MLQSGGVRTGFSTDAYLRGRNDTYDGKPADHLTSCKNPVRVWEGWFGYDRKKYAAMLREAFEPFVLCLPRIAEENLLTDSLTEEELKRFPLFAALTITRS